MRASGKDPKSSLSVNLISGLYVVLIGINLDEADKTGLLGFAIQRTDLTENEKYFLPGFKTFKETDPQVPSGTLVATDTQPVQTFLWGDFTAKPKHKYLYKVITIYGAPKNLEQRHSIEIPVETYDVDSQSLTHIAIFNRGVAGSQAYARKFGNKAPDEVPNREAWDWLSRGLDETILSFIGEANSGSKSLKCAFYEFQNDDVLKALGKAATTGANVEVIYDDRRDDPKIKNEAAIKRNGIENICKPRSNNPSYIAHNKFMLLFDNDEPVKLLTGSTNISDGGIFGHANEAHIIRDGDIVKQFLKYWEELQKDSPAKELRPWDDTNSPSGNLPPIGGTIPVFSPQSTLTTLDWYAQLMEEAAGPVFFTAAFGVNSKFQDVLLQKKPYLRYILLETEDSRQSDDKLSEIMKDPNIRIAVGAIIVDPPTRFLLEKLTGLNKHVNYIHTKFMIIDPLGPKPILITGSANFSNNSTTQNDENMVVINSNKDIMDMYLGEFMRLFNHFYVRDWIGKKEAGNDDDAVYLVPDESWTKDYFDPTKAKYKQREYFKAQIN